ncbi:MAG: outer membrane beta-barrel protein, partial [Gammaproteobacteria bacterium]|nr:outer membrane beta-barrel protein [Gammaproteobacteria bacterium]
TEDTIVDFDSALDQNLEDYHRTRVSLTYQNGTDRNRTRYEAYLFRDNSTTDYQNLQARSYDLDQTGVGGLYAWQVRRQIALVAEGRYIQSDFPMNIRDNTHLRAMIGADMFIGRRIRTSFRVGYAEKTFDTSIAGNRFGEPVWNGTFEWDLRRNTSVRMETGRKIYELATVDQPNDASKFNIHNWISAAWVEQWTEKLSTNTSYTYRDTSYEGRDGNEGAHQFVVSARYYIRHNLRCAIDMAYTKIGDDLGEDVSRRTFTFRIDYNL